MGESSRGGRQLAFILKRSHVFQFMPLSCEIVQCDAPPPDCSFTSGEPASCGAGCGYSAARPNRTSASWPLALGSAVFTSWKNASFAFAVDVSLPRSLAEKQARSLVSQTCSAISAASVENCSTVERFY